MNPFEKNILKLKGISYFENVCFEGIEDDVLDFGDLLLKPGEEKLCKRYFEMKNYSSNTVRYKWKDRSDQFDWIKIEPQIGHIPPN